MSPEAFKLIIESGVIAAKEFLKYVNNIQSQINELRAIQIKDYDILVENFQNELDMIKDFYNNSELTQEQRQNLIDQMEDLNTKISLELAKKSEFIEKEKEETKKQKEKAFKIAAEVLTGVIPFTTIARAINKKKEEDAIEHKNKSKLETNITSKK